ncbi:MAG: glycosyl hydrolase [Planctomycetota bacterium]|jgi:hypothetical protein
MTTKFFVTVLFIGIQITGTGIAQYKPVPPTDPKLSPNAKKLYDWLCTLPNRTDKRMIAGQVFDRAWTAQNKWDESINKGYSNNILAVEKRTGKPLGLLHSWLDFPWIRGERHMSAEFVYPVYYNQYHRGAVLMLLVNPYNPFTGRGIKGHPPKGTSLSDLVKPGSQQYEVYREYLENLADLLSYFAKDDIPIIIRLFGENNGKWFWFHHGYEKTSPKDFKALWKYTVTFLRQKRRLHNLLFCYEVAESQGNYLAGLVPKYTDILGIQCQRQPMEGTIELYKQYLPYNKPIMIPQFLPDSNGDLNYKSFIDAVKKFHPRLVAFSPWDSGPFNKKTNKYRRWSLIDNLGLKEMMDDPWVINRNDTPFFNPGPPTELSVPKNNSEGTSKAPAGKLSWNFDGNGNNDTEGWKKADSVLKMHVADRRLNVFYHGKHPAIKGRDNLNIDTKTYTKFRIRMRNHSTSEKTAIKWVTDKDPKYNRVNVVYVDVKKNQLNYTEYTAELSKHAGWKDIITSVKVLPALHSVTGSTEIDYIAFTKE